MTMQAIIDDASLIQPEIVAGLWARYEAETKPLGNPEIARALGVASFVRGQRDWGQALGHGNPINILDLTHFKAGWTAAKASADELDGGAS